MVVPGATFFVVPEIVIVLPNVTLVELATIVMLGFGLPPLGGFAATAGPAQTRMSASAAPIRFMYLKRTGAPQVVVWQKKRRPEAPLGSACRARSRGRRAPGGASIRGRG